MGVQNECVTPKHATLAEGLFWAQDTWRSRYKNVVLTSFLPESRDWRSQVEGALRPSLHQEETNTVTEDKELLPRKVYTNHLNLTRTFLCSPHISSLLSHDCYSSFNLALGPICFLGLRFPMVAPMQCKNLHTFLLLICFTSIYFSGPARDPKRLGVMPPLQRSALIY